MKTRIVAGIPSIADDSTVAIHDFVGHIRNATPDTARAENFDTSQRDRRRRPAGSDLGLAFNTDLGV